MVRKQGLSVSVCSIRGQTTSFVTVPLFHHKHTNTFPHKVTRVATKTKVRYHRRNCNQKVKGHTHTTGCYGLAILGQLAGHLLYTTIGFKGFVRGRRTIINGTSFTQTEHLPTTHRPLHQGHIIETTGQPPYSGLGSYQRLANCKVGFHYFGLLFGTRLQRG